jgi:two-component system sensor histidine kinase UhpB
MSLKLRLLTSVAALLVFALLLGGTVLGWRARTAVREEIRTTFANAGKEVDATLAGDTQHTLTMRQVIAALNDERNVRGFLLNEDNNVVAASRIAAVGAPAPAWFVSLIAPPQLTARIAIPIKGFPCVLLLKSDDGNEVGEIWQLVRDAFTAMALFSAVTLLFVWLIVDRALGFFRRVQNGLGTISEGDYAARLTAEGPPEFTALANGFNHMAARLSDYRKLNHRLQKQILSLQEEERAEIARDLHDEVGPYLFAIQVDADAVAKSGDAPARELAGGIREAALHIQHHVKFILRQLRPVAGLDFGLETAIDDMIAFWKRRHPEIAFERKIDFGIRLDRRGEETIYRIVQESVSNSVRHGRPHLITIMLTDAGDGVRLTVEDDGDGIDAAPEQSGMGLKGMAERVQALNGQFTIEKPERGVRICASLPRTDTREMEDA